LAAFEEGLGRVADGVARAAEMAAPARERERWVERVRAGLVALLGFFDDEPGWGRLLLDGAPAGLELECRRRAQGVLGELLAGAGDGPGEPGQGEPGRSEPGQVGEPEHIEESGRGDAGRELVGELVLGGVFSVIRARMLAADGGPLVELAPSLMSFIVAAYLARGGASEELAGTSVLASEPGGEGSRAAGLPVRATYRTTCVLRAIASAPRSSNREIAQAAGLADEGQTSKLLGRLERRGLIENVGLGAACGEPNAWLLTPDGRRVVKAIGHGFTVGSAVRGTRRVRGAA